MRELALLVYEAFITLDGEVRHIWKRSPSAASWLYLLNRYLVLLLYLVNLALSVGASDAVSPKPWCPVLLLVS